MAVSGEPIHPRIAALATAVPKHVIHQAEALEGARRLFAGRAREFERMAPAFANAGIDTRHSSVPVEWYFEPHGWPDRTERFVETALSQENRSAWRLIPVPLTAAELGERWQACGGKRPVLRREPPEDSERGGFWVYGLGFRVAGLVRVREIVTAI